MEAQAGAQTPGESRIDMLSRHQNEIKALRDKELEMKKEAAKGSKAVQKSKKKAVEEEVSALDSALKQRHEQELATLGFVADENSQAKDLDVLVKAMAGVTTAMAGPASAKPTKGKKWRDKRAQKEADREQRIKEEQSRTVSSRTVEDEKLEAKLKPLGLGLREIKPDGHCLYRALEDQLSLHQALEQHSYEQLRAIAASYIRSNSQVFLPFIGSEESDKSSCKKLEEYCNEVEFTAAWGGQLELEALSHGLKKHIVVFSGDMANVEMGQEYSTAAPTLRLSYHRHAFGLGEHYNSVVPEPEP